MMPTVSFSTPLPNRLYLLRLERFIGLVRERAVEGVISAAGTPYAQAPSQAILLRARSSCWRVIVVAVAGRNAKSCHRVPAQCAGAFGCKGIASGAVPAKRSVRAS